MKEAYLYQKLKQKKVKCQNCAHYCLILPGDRGVCRTRENAGGKLFALNYGKIIARGIDPIEKKPFFHFLPGSKTYSIASEGCNFRCGNCQNWRISQKTKNPEFLEISGEQFTPLQVVKSAQKQKCASIAYTYTEPTIFSEFAFDTMKLARQEGLKNIWVSNGFMSKESAEMVIPYLDANNIDIKSFSDDFYSKNCGGHVGPILETAQLMKKSGVWIEITSLAITGMSDSKQNFSTIAKFIYDKLGAETPWHISAFSSCISWKLKNIPDTPYETLVLAHDVGQKAGLKHVYIGNSPGSPLKNTYCPKCGELCIGRIGYNVSRFDQNGCCSKCKFNLNIIQ